MTSGRAKGPSEPGGSGDVVVTAGSGNSLAGKLSDGGAVVRVGAATSGSSGAMLIGTGGSVGG